MWKNIKTNKQDRDRVIESRLRALVEEGVGGGSGGGGLKQKGKKRERTHGQGQTVCWWWGKEWVKVEEGIGGVILMEKYNKKST